MPSVNTPLRGDVDLVQNRVRSIGGVQVLLANGASGAPTSGHHIAGEFHTDQAGTAHVCTATGQPGTWSTLGAVGTVDAGTLTGTTLASNVVTSSLTSLGTLTGLTMGGAATIGAHVLSLAGSTVTGQPTWSSNQALVVSTAAQPNITSLGTLTSLTLGLGSDANGDVWYRSSGTFARLGIGSAGQVLAVNSGATAPAWTGGMTLFNDQTLGAPAATISVSSIPATYKNLVFHVNGRVTGAVTIAQLAIQINTDTAGNYDRVAIQGAGSSASSIEALGGTNASVGVMPGSPVTRAAIASSTVLTIPNYAGTTWEKSWTSESGFVDSTSGNNTARHSTGSWRSTSAINQVDFITNGTSFATGTRVTTYLLN